MVHSRGGNCTCSVTNADASSLRHLPTIAPPQHSSIWLRQKPWCSHRCARAQWLAERQLWHSQDVHARDHRQQQPSKGVRSVRLHVGCRKVSPHQCAAPPFSHTSLTLPSLHPPLQHLGAHCWRLPLLPSTDPARLVPARLTAGRLPIPAACHRLCNGQCLPPHTSQPPLARLTRCDTAHCPGQCCWACNRPLLLTRNLATRTASPTALLAVLLLHPQQAWHAHWLPTRQLGDPTAAACRAATPWW